MHYEHRDRGGPASLARIQSCPRSSKRSKLPNGLWASPSESWCLARLECTLTYWDTLLHGSPANLGNSATQAGRGGWGGISSYLISNQCPRSRGMPDCSALRWWTYHEALFFVLSSEATGSYSRTQICDPVPVSLKGDHQNETGQLPFGRFHEGLKSCPNLLWKATLGQINLSNPALSWTLVPSFVRLWTYSIRSLSDNGGLVSTTISCGATGVCVWAVRPWAIWFISLCLMWAGSDLWPQLGPITV